MFQPDPRRLGNTLSPSKSLCVKMGRGARHYVSLIYRGSHQTPVNMPLHGWYRMLRTCTRKYDVNEQPLKKNDSQRLKELVFPDLKKRRRVLGQAKRSLSATEEKNGGRNCFCTPSLLSVFCDPQ